jgi:hypothetical protein
MQGTEKVTDMRKILFSILLASVAASPALAQDQGNGRWHHDHQQQQSNEQQHQDRGRGERGQQIQVQQAPQQVQNVQRGNFDRGRFQGAPQQVQVQQQAEQSRQRWNGERGNRGGFTGQQTQQAEQYQQRWNGNRSNWNGQSNPVYQQQVQNRTRWANSGSWNRDWRNDRRYDWRRYRDSHRSIFRLGVYIDPFGYGYQPFGIGYDLSPVYFSQQYWIDPAMYSLPYPPPGTQWVRYWNDAVLVDMYSGQVVDVIHNFFW